jgi:DNA recombination-dependent growth factor C
MTFAERLRLAIKEIEKNSHSKLNRNELRTLKTEILQEVLDEQKQKA